MVCKYQGRDKEKRRINDCNWCFTSADYSVHSRRCFMTGEYCSKQTNIQHQRKKQYSQSETTITAFVVMNFSDMSDVVYKWKLKPFIESLTKYLYLDFDNKRIYCSKSEEPQTKNGLRKVKKINVVRSDSNPSSNFVVCSRICQQMQISDIVIIDVSSQNANVFYEFGMAVALGKLILPICYSESFYKMDQELFDRSKLYKPSEPGEPALTKHDFQADGKQHIGCYPWRKNLFEYYGIKYKNEAGAHTIYADYEYATWEYLGFPDVKYRRFPYGEKVQGERSTSEDIIGRRIYHRLSDGYNNAGAKDNTLVVYTIEGFLNDNQAGICIVNFYHDITARMRTEQCFCGERVGVLVQEKVIPEDEKDAEKQLDLYYNVGEIIHIGINQATYLSEEEKIKTADELRDPELYYPATEQKEEIKRFVKEHIRNRGMLIYPNNPVYVSRMKNQIQENLLDNMVEEETDCRCCNGNAFVLYHVMLRNLRYTNEIVVDISDNCLQSLFWLGAAHGSDINAITVLHDKTDKEREANNSIAGNKSRNVFDVAGLWTAILKKNDTEGFYRQLAQAQTGIENHSKLLASANDYYEKNIREYLLSFKPERENSHLEDLFKDKEAEEHKQLESYYRKQFRNSMLRYNRLTIYLAQQNDKNPDDSEPRIRIAKWDFDAVSALTHYLSKRTVIGEYLVKSLQNTEDDKRCSSNLEQNIKREPDIDAAKTNFICVGAFAEPLNEELPTYISKHIGNKSPNQEKNEIYNNINIIHKRAAPIIIEAQAQLRECKSCNKKPCTKKRVYKGFECIKGGGKSLYTQHSQSQCAEAEECDTGFNPYCGGRKEKQHKIYEQLINDNPPVCNIAKDCSHMEIAQLILWREAPDGQHGRSFFRVGMYGSSGPATYALSALFVDEEQKKAYFPDETENPPYLLSKLQEKVRKKFMDVFLMQLDKQLQTIMPDAGDNKVPVLHYISMVIHAASYYLSTVLYRYFLPFLSDVDIDCIYNGMYMFMHSMKAAQVPPFTTGSMARNNIKSIHVIDKVLETLLNLLKGFTGYEVFYEVKVAQRKDKDSNRDTRFVKGIKLIEPDEINYFFINL